LFEQFGRIGIAEGQGLRHLVEDGSVGRPDGVERLLIFTADRGVPFGRLLAGRLDGRRL